jgi:hypothetical protein
MTPGGMTERTRAQTGPWPARLPARSRWPAGTLAAAGTIPARTMNAYATLVFSQGHHPANHRSAIPTRVYESGSGHGHDAAPAGHPHPPRAPPRPHHYSRPMPAPPSSAPVRPHQGRLRRRCASSASAPRPLTRPSRAHESGAYQGMGTPQPAHNRPSKPAPKPPRPPKPRRTICKNLTSRFI